MTTRRDRRRGQETSETGPRPKEAFLGTQPKVEGSMTRTHLSDGDPPRLHHERVRRLEGKSWSAEGSNRARR